MPFLTRLGLEPAASELQDHSPDYKATAAPTVCIMHCIIYYRILYYSPHWFAFSADLVLDGTHFEDIVVTGMMWNTDNTSRAICIKMREIIIEQVEWWFEICKTSGRRSFTQLSCLYAFTLPLESYLKADSHVFFLGLCLINPSISLLCPTNPASVKPPFIFSPFLPTSCPYSRRSPSLFLIDSSRVSESSTALVTERAWDHLPRNFKHSVYSRSWIICLQANPAEDTDSFCFVIGAHQCQVSLLSRRPRPTPQNAEHVLFIYEKCKCMIFFFFFCIWIFIHPFSFTRVFLFGLRG